MSTGNFKLLDCMLTLIFSFNVSELGHNLVLAFRRAKWTLMTISYSFCILLYASGNEIA